MGKRGKLDWDEAMMESGHRTTTNKNKKWSSRLRASTKNKNVVDSITREQVNSSRVCKWQILNERLEALERDNDEDEDTVNEADLYDEEEDVLLVCFCYITGSRGTSKEAKRVSTYQVTVVFCGVLSTRTTFPVFKFARVVFQDVFADEWVCCVEEQQGVGRGTMLCECIK